MYAAILVGVIIIAMSIFFVYSSDQAKMRGEAFGKALEFIQEDLRKLTHSFDSKVSMFKQGDISKGEFWNSLKNMNVKWKKLFYDMIIYKYHNHSFRLWNYSNYQLKHS